MTSKERVLAAIAGETPDRVPVDFSANPATLQRLMRDFLVESHADLLQALHVDVVDLRGMVDPVYRGPVPEKTVHTDGVTENSWGMKMNRIGS